MSNKRSSTHAQDVTMCNKQYLFLTSFNIEFFFKFFLISPIKLKLGLQKVRDY